LERAEFEQFVLPHLSIGSRGPPPKLSLYKIFNSVLKILYLGCQWKELPIHKDDEGHPETHYTRIYHIWRRWVDTGCMDAIFAGSVARLHADGRLDTAVIHGDGTTTAAKKDDLRANRKAIFNRGMVPNINPNPRGGEQPKRGRKPIFEPAIFKERFRTIERMFAWEDKFRRLLLRFERISGLHYAFKTLAYTMINFRHYCQI
jgi:transposase